MRHSTVCLLTLSFTTTLFPSVSLSATNNIETVVVTATREARVKSELAESVGVLDQQSIEEIMPAHPAEALNRIAGVYINNLGGEGHMTSIRQPLTTGGVYLFLEDGLPTRPTGFFNHNGLYEVNVSQASQLEVTKGPGSALYGSDAIGGIINSLTAAPSAQGERQISLEGGSDGWFRALIKASDSVSENARAGIQLNITENDGFRDEANYDRTSLSGRWDIDINDHLSAKTVLSYTEVSQSGVSALSEEDYKNNPEKNLYHGQIGFRDVNALRISSEWHYTHNQQGLLSFTPYYRRNETELMPSWMITYDPNIGKTDFETFGLNSKYRRFFANGKGEFITGMDFDYTPAQYKERRISVLKDGEIYTSHNETGRESYHYDADQTTASPYIHTEWVIKNWRLSAGLRYDYFRVKYNDKLDASVPELGPIAIVWGQARPAYTHFRPDDQTITHEQWSPKLGAVYDINDHHNVYVNYRHAFRTPTIGQLFRAGSTTNSDELEAVNAKSLELGARGTISKKLSYEIALYQMNIEDDIVSIIDNSSFDRKRVNAGETRHRGLELGIDAQINDEWAAGLSAAFTEQTYQDFSYICGSSTCNYEGNNIAKAPQTLGNLTVAYTPIQLTGLRLEAEWEHLGEYYTDETNTQEYGGHDLLNLRGSYQFDEQWQIFTRIQNLTDKRYSTYTSNRVGNPNLDYRPGMPLSLIAGVKVNF